MLSFTQKVDHSRTHHLGVTLAVEIDRLDFRSALVIEESTALRGSIVQFLKKRGLIKILTDLETHGRWKRQAYAN